ncbi:three-Cys-motif partner protein TcmP [Paenibacillus piri]|uniref:Three-Cys-motif partner protein TcmP n=1 Tax=Paenibacillus piri TaxID=2547395 RepID=A0A4R5KIW0_9BACL|nr:three-Cys-motif partner protein TcmP [Paenibacillus piri]TDF94708.1 three-Cys-motif partner protein TcmP [Paenibacillus piri]
MSNEHEHWLEKSNHTRLKHHILQFYLENWSRILADASFHNNQEDIYYIDGFAGRGEFLDGDLGSPLIALEEMEKVQRSFNEQYPHKPLRFHIINIENNEGNFFKLEELRRKNRTSVSIQNLHGNFLVESKKVLLRDSLKKCACFWFVDPFYGARDFSFEHVIDLLFFPNGSRRIRKEVLINFMTYNIVRFIRYDKEQPFILKFLGAASYNEVVESGNSVKLEEAIISFYKSKLRDQGLFVLSQRIQCKDPKDPHSDLIYFHMIHCSHSERALLEMRESFVKAQEQKNTFEKELNGGQIDLFDLELIDPTYLEYSKQQLIDFIKNNFGLGKSILLHKIFVMTLQEVQVSHGVICEMLQELWKENIIKVINQDGTNRRKPFNRTIKDWKSIEIVLLKDKATQSEPIGEQLTLF